MSRVGLRRPLVFAATFVCRPQINLVEEHRAVSQPDSGRCEVRGVAGTCESEAPSRWTCSGPPPPPTGHHRVRLSRLPRAVHARHDAPPGAESGEEMIHWSGGWTTVHWIKENGRQAAIFRVTDGVPGLKDGAR